MAFILANSTTLCRDMWPSGVGVLVQEKMLTASNVPPARLLPRAIEDLTEWLWVDLQPELSLALVYIRSDVEGGTSVSDADVAPTVGVVEEQDAQAPEHVELVIRLTGLIADMNLNVGGDWDGTEAHAIKATQHLTLVSGGYTDAFDPQARALNAVRAAVLALLGRCDDGRPSRTGSIVLRKRVFTKIRSGVNDNLPSVIKKAEDPKGKYHAIRNSWRVTERVLAGAHQADGTILATLPLALRKGDFVDVSVSVCIAMLRGGQGRRFEVSFEPRVIVRLATPQQWTRIITPPRLRGARDVPKEQQPARKALVVGFKFAGNTEEVVMEEG
ncbi:hypothetical protein VTO73DRAFT_8915 [Trametes versicolor]